MEKQQTILVVNADDFGLSKKVNQGIEEAYQKGILRSTSLMANGAAFEDAVEIAKRNPGLGVGVHISLVGEYSVGPFAYLGRLIDINGALPSSYMAFAKAYAFHRFGVGELEVEIEAQVNRILETGIHPTHIDSHQHIHLMPGILPLLLDIAQDAKIPVIRIPWERKGVNLNPVSLRSVQLHVLAHLGRSGFQIARKNGFHCPDYFWGVGASGSMTEENLKKTLSLLKPGVNEIMCHPGYGDPETRSKYPWGYHWEEEESALLSPEISEILKSKEIQLANFKTAWE